MKPLLHIKTQWIHVWHLILFCVSFVYKAEQDRVSGVVKEGVERLWSKSDWYIMHLILTLAWHVVCIGFGMPQVFLFFIIDVLFDPFLFVRGIQNISKLKDITVSCILHEVCFLHEVCQSCNNLVGSFSKTIWRIYRCAHIPKIKVLPLRKNLLGSKCKAINYYFAYTGPLGW